MSAENNITRLDLKEVLGKMPLAVVNKVEKKAGG